MVGQSQATASRPLTQECAPRRHLDADGRQVISVVAPQRPRAATVAKVGRVPGLAQSPNEMFGDAFPLFEFLIFLSFENYRRLGRMCRLGLPIAPHSSLPAPHLALWGQY